MLGTGTRQEDQWTGTQNTWFSFISFLNLDISNTISLSLSGNNFTCSIRIKKYFFKSNEIIMWKIYISIYIWIYHCYYYQAFMSRSLGYPKRDGVEWTCQLKRYVKFKTERRLSPNTTVHFMLPTLFPQSYPLELYN